jgi:hypothetical protein
MATAVDTRELEAKVKDMYRQVAEGPAGEYEFISERARDASAKYG